MSADQSESPSRRKRPLGVMAAPPSEPLRIRISLRPSQVISDPLVDENEVLEMIKGRPEDEDFIYLDVDGGDEPADAAWSPKARVIVKRPSDALSTRPKRNKRRKVVESCLASASAKLSSQESSLEEDEDYGDGDDDDDDEDEDDAGDEDDTNRDDDEDVDKKDGKDVMRRKKAKKAKTSTSVTSDGAERRRRRRRNGGTSANTRTRTRKQVQRKKELKKGHRTAKQRLAQAIGLWKGVRSS